MIFEIIFCITATVIFLALGAICTFLGVRELMESEYILGILMLLFGIMIWSGFGAVLFAPLLA